jgi:iron complex transport system substrate-binding protein
MRRLRSLLLVLPLAIAVGCQSTAVQIVGKNRPKRYNAIVSLSPSTTEIVASMAYSAKLVGRTAADNYPMSVAKVTVVASVKPDYEMIATLKPDMVLYDADLYGPSDIEKIKALGADTWVMDAKTVDSYLDQVRRLGSMLAAETNTASYVDKVYGARSTAQAEAKEPKPKVAIILPGQGTEHMIAGANSFYADVLKSVGATVVGPEAEKFVNVNPEWFISQNPDAIVIGVNKADPPSANEAVMSLLKDPRFKNVNAISKKQIIAIDQDVLLRRGWRVDKLIDGLRQGLASTGGK